MNISPVTPGSLLAALVIVPAGFVAGGAAIRWVVRNNHAAWLYAACAAVLVIVTIWMFRDPYHGIPHRAHRCWRIP